MDNKHIFTLHSSDSRDGHEYTFGIKHDIFTHIIYVHKDGEVWKQFSSEEAAWEYIDSKRKD